MWADGLVAVQPRLKARTIITASGMDERLQDALAMAVRNCGHTRGVTILHSDRGTRG